MPTREGLTQLESKQCRWKPVTFVHYLLYYCQICKLLKAVGLFNLNKNKKKKTQNTQCQNN